MLEKPSCCNKPMWVSSIWGYEGQTKRTFKCTICTNKVTIPPTNKEKPKLIFPMPKQKEREWFIV